MPAVLGRLSEAKAPQAPTRSTPGLLTAAAVLSAWALAMFLGLRGEHPGAGHIIADGLWIALTTFLSTGVFITAHDAMHGLIAPGNAALNRAIGWFATWSYAGLNYAALERAHHEHHAKPASGDDPDFHRGDPGFVAWYISFMRQYLSWAQFAWLCLLLAVMIGVLEMSVARVALFWATPLILSTFQLFIVGTWLPHRPGAYLGDGPLRARSVDLPPWLSFLACYHFGYHFEHHARPDLPWWRLWRVRGYRGLNAS
uniref:Beta-carotene ketolase CrtW n=1 Tax=uncultured bacterium HF186_25m_30B18 TaxID=662885 RepID=C7FPA3_9BACT|nr:beta-carotene ketolase CrtW [uncultured bacterium HF186_25m_30B18]